MSFEEALEKHFVMSSGVPVIKSMLTNALEVMYYEGRHEGWNARKAVDVEIADTDSTLCRVEMAIVGCCAGNNIADAIREKE